jgi:hypothetical protein
VSGLRSGAAALLVLAAAGCGGGPVGPGPAPEFRVGTVTVRLVSGGVKRLSGQLHLYLSDQIDTCAAVANAPTLTTTYLQLVVAPPTSGPQAATVVSQSTTLAPGLAVGKVQQTTGTTLGTAYDAADGTLTWSGGATGDVILETIDVGFAPMSGRVTATGLRLTACN